jgi:hypothetical protein
MIERVKLMDSAKLIRIAASLFFILACSSVNTAVPQITSTLPATVNPVQNGIPVFASPIRLVIPSELGTGVSAETIDVVTDQTGQSWEIAPSHLQLTLQGYSLLSSFHVPQFFVYPAPDYEAVNPAAAMSISNLKRILTSNSLPAQDDGLPNIPFWNAGQVFASREKIIEFNGGAGLRSITQYAQDVSPINNGGLFYHFEGLTDNGQFYIVGVLPANLPFLPVDNDPASAIPPGGIAFPQNNASGSSYQDYFKRVTDLINNSSDDQFEPSLNTLDMLIRSISISSQ